MAKKLTDLSKETGIAVNALYKRVIRLGLKPKLEIVGKRKVLYLTEEEVYKVLNVRGKAIPPKNPVYWKLAEFDGENWVIKAVCLLEKKAKEMEKTLTKQGRTVMITKQVKRKKVTA